MVDLDSIEVALAKMTPGKLKVVPGLPNYNSARLFSDNVLVAIVTNSDMSTDEIDADADGIALLRNNADEMVREIRRLRQFVADSGSTCYPCESCGHARTTRECLRCDIKELRALCGEAADAIRTLEDTPHFIATEHENMRSRLRAASKGEK